MANPVPIIRYATAVPTGTGEFNQAGTIIVNSAPTDGAFQMAVCTADGRPGTWVNVSYAGSMSKESLTAAAVLAVGKGLHLLNGGNSFTLAAGASHASGFVTRIKNVNATTTTIATVAGATYADAAAITLAQWASVTLVSDGTAAWLKAD